MRLGDLTVKDLIDAGWSKEDILTIATSDKMTEPEPDPETKEPEPEKKEAEPENKDPELEQSPEMTALQEELNKTKQALLDAQKANRNKDFLDNNNDDEKVLMDFFNNY